ncbi:MAG: tetratricopeptide repeat protein [Bacteroidia bacterium]
MPFTAVGQTSNVNVDLENNIDSNFDSELSSIDKTTNPTEYVKLKLKKGQEFLNMKSFDNALNESWQLLRFCKSETRKELPDVYGLLGLIYKEIYLSDSALFYFENQYLLLNNSETELRLSVLKHLTSLHKQNGSLSKALDYCIIGIRLAEKIDNKKLAGNFNNKIGSIYNTQKNYTKANEYFLEAFSLYDEINYELGKASTYSNIGNTFLNQDNFTEAESYFNRAKTIYDNEEDNVGIAKMISLLGKVNFKKGDIQSAIEFQRNALLIRITDNNLGELPESYVDLANSYLKLRRYDDALNLTREGLGITRKTGSEIQLLRLYKQFYLIYKDLNYKDSALWYHEKYGALKDTIDRLENDEMMIRLQNAFDTERRELELSEMKKANELNQERITYYKELEEKDEYLKILLSSVIIILLIVAVLFFSRYRIKSKANFEISKKVQENELLLKELHHRVKNNLQFISSLLAIKVKKIEDPVAENMVEESLQKVRAMSMVHNTLNQNSSDDPNINLKTFLQGLTQSLGLSLGLESDQISFTYKWRKAEFDLDSFNAIGLVINEMITNSVKHCDSDSLKIKIGFFENSKYKMIRYWDNGPGLDSNFFTSDKQMGITLMRLLVADLGGTFKYDEPKEGETGIRINVNINKSGKNG